MILRRLRALERPITVNLIGAGAMGQGLLYQFLRTPGMRCVGLAEINLPKARGVLERFNCPYDVVETPAAARSAMERGRVALCEDGMVLANMGGVDCLVESTSSVLEAGRFCVAALEHGQHLCLMNAEADLIFGPELMRLARAHGVTMFSCDGDQHGVIKRLIDEVTLWGFEPVMAGNIKGFLRRSATPTDILPEAQKRNLDPRMCAAYTDGTKLCIEMALLANAMGYRTDVVGMHGPACADVDDVLSTEAFHWDELRAGGPVVDYILGANPGGGVYLVAHHDHPYQRDMMAYYKMGAGPYYTFYRPYHLCHVEAVRCIAEAVLDHRPLLEPAHGFLTQVVAYAKTDLPAGAHLEGIGGHTCYGLIENTRAAASDPGAASGLETVAEGLPICLADELVLRRPLAAGERIAMTDVDTPVAREDLTLYRRAVEASAALATA